MAICIQTSNLTKCYGAVVAVGGLSVKIEAGEVFGLLGPNGAGKSTTLCMLTGLVPPTSGSVTVFGKDLRRQFLEVAPRMGVLMERPAFYDHLSARDNLLLLARLTGRDVTVDRTLDRVGLLDAADRKVKTFSHGMRQRLGLAQALLSEPELLVLDEPTSALDVESAQEVLQILRFLADEAHVTVVVASHMLHEVEVLCDRIAILNRGRLVACEATGPLLSYDQSHVDVLIDAAEAAAKRLAGEPWVESVQAQAGRLTVRLGDGSVHQLTTFLVGAGYRISGVIPRRRSLQDYFLKVLNS
ncbi:MAG: ABC transporter ATP-binding protein [Candidatus Hydrogenedentes bacterium]|nr:ABC transporter ATP-binding protein [Candidatus Hydrogenedentota bacterium]